MRGENDAVVVVSIWSRTNVSVEPDQMRIFEKTAVLLSFVH